MADVPTPLREKKIRDGKTAKVSANLAYCARAWAEGKAATLNYCLWHSIYGQPLNRSSLCSKRCRVSLIYYQKREGFDGDVGSYA